MDAMDRRDTREMSLFAPFIVGSGGFQYRSRPVDTAGPATDSAKVANELFLEEEDSCAHHVWCRSLCDSHQYCPVMGTFQDGNPEQT